MVGVEMHCFPEGGRHLQGVMQKTAGRNGKERGAGVKIIISSQGGNLDSAVDPRFGRAAQFILYDTETASYETISNAQSLDAAQGAGIKAAETISRLGAQVLITGHCGPKAFETLKAAGIQTSLHYPPAHRFTYYQERFGKIDLPRTEALRKEIAGYQDEIQKEVIAHIAESKKIMNPDQQKRFIELLRASSDKGRAHSPFTKN